MPTKSDATRLNDATGPFEWKTIVAQTGRSWDEWYDLLDAAGGRTATHRQLTRYLEQAGLVSGWWCQAIVTNYERAVGARAIGQNCRSEWIASARVTLDHTLDEALARWVALAHVDVLLNSAPPVAEPTVSGSAKFRYWRARLADGTRIDVTITHGARAGSAAVSVQHARLEDAAMVAQMRDYWRERLRSLKM